MKKKIAIINSVYNIGSTGRICFELSNFLINNGFDVKTFYGRGKNSQKNSVYFGSKLGNYAHGCLSRIFGCHGLYSYLATYELLKELHRFNPDLVILNNLHGYYVNYKILLGYLSKIDIPVLSVFHDCWNITGHCAHYLYNRCNNWKNECRNCKFLRDYPKSLFFDRSHKNYELKKKLFLSIKNLTIISPSEWMAEQIGNSFLRSKIIKVINNGIDTSLFKKKSNPIFRSKYHLTNKKIILCVAYNFDDKKGLNDILKLSKMIRNNEVIVMVGKIRNKNVVLPPNIINISKTDDINELIDIYSSGDVFFNATYEDTYSNVNMEALSCGLPVVCYKSGGACEMIDKEFAVETGNLDCAYDLIKQLLDKEKVYKMPFSNSFSKEDTYIKYLELIKDVL